ncbi:hypothetical protein E2C01_051116 [Portunus trituberculatus]|uniref:Uncharacterized protein n=1 Tax=Portunus trituberculatus TaxID=210409 RepID=A0A5B7GDX2_PORTR|nr:hypothetical protein [Portunus trituberculatus]
MTSGMGRGGPLPKTSLHRKGNLFLRLARSPRSYTVTSGIARCEPLSRLRHRRGEPHGRSSDILQPSILSPFKQGKDIPRGSRALVNSLLRCAPAMAFIIIMYHVTLEWL